MQIEISKTIKETVDVPKYWKSKSSNHFYKQNNEDYCTQVSLFADWGTSIGIVSLATGFCQEHIEIQEFEYTDALDKAISILCVTKPNP